MPQELAYVIITPYSLHKSRTGGILARLISRTSLEMVGARMFAPSPELVHEYSNVIVRPTIPGQAHSRVNSGLYLQNLARTQDKKAFTCDGAGLQGEDAVRKVRSVVGNINADRRGGDHPRHLR